jgi:PAS domain-containing protein
MTNEDSRIQLAAELAALRNRVRELESQGRVPVRPDGPLAADPASAAERVLESSADGAFGIDPGGRVTFFNSVASELTGWAVDDAVGGRRDRHPQTCLARRHAPRIRRLRQRHHRAP